MEAGSGFGWQLRGSGACLQEVIEASGAIVLARGATRSRAVAREQKTMRGDGESEPGSAVISWGHAIAHYAESEEASLLPPSLCPLGRRLAIGVASKPSVSLGRQAQIGAASLSSAQLGSAQRRGSSSSIFLGGR